MPTPEIAPDSATKTPPQGSQRPDSAPKSPPKHQFAKELALIRNSRQLAHAQTVVTAAQDRLKALAAERQQLEAAAATAARAARAPLIPDLDAAQEPPPDDSAAALSFALNPSATNLFP